MSSLWYGSALEFVERCRDKNGLVDLLSERYEEHHGRPAQTGQLNAWRNSLPALAQAIEQAGLTAAQVAVEYRLPLTGLTVDAVVFGRNGAGVCTACIVELKQWTHIKKSGDIRFPFWVTGMEQPQRHPLTQVLAYRDYLAQCHELSDRIHFAAAAYMHEMLYGSSSWKLLCNEKLMEQAELFSAPLPLAEWLRVKAGNEEDSGELGTQFHAFLEGGYQPAVAFLDRMRTLFIEMRLTEDASQAVASSAWQLTSLQQQTVDQVMDAVMSGRRQAFVITGEPGSGKTVVALNLVKSAFVEGKHAIYATGNGGLEAVARESMQLWGHVLVKNVREFRQDKRKSVSDLLVIDESQRLWGSSHQEVDDLLARGRVVVYLLDDGQILRTDENGTRDFVIQRIAASGVPYEHVNLTEHFRCGGGPAFMKRVEILLGLSSGGNGKVDWDRSAYPVVVQPTLSALRACVQSWTGPNDRSGLVCALTPTARRLVSEPIQVRQLRELRAFYNDRQSNDLTRPVSIYSVQGLELDYVGMIWGEDFVRRSGKWVAQTDKAEKSLKNLDHDTALSLLRNRYWVLLTRGIKGLAIFCTDPETADYIRSML